MNISPQLESNITFLETAFTDCNDVIKRKIPLENNTNVYIMYIDGLVARNVIEDSVLTNVVLRMKNHNITDNFTNMFDAIKDGGFGTADIKEVEKLDDVSLSVMSGDTAFLIDGFPKAIIISTKGWPNRGVNKPDTEMVIQGSKEAFSEALRINTVLVRRRIRDTKLKVKQMQIGEESRTDIAVIYIEGIVRPQVLNEVLQKLKEIKIAAVLDSGYIQQCFENGSFFPLGQVTERPDKTAASVLEGRVAIICDNSPFALIVPATLPTFYQASEDYYTSVYISSFIRIIRYIAGGFAVLLPGLYLAISAYHPDMLPTALMLKMAAARVNIPIPGVLEVLVMEIAFELLREAGIRLPAPIGGTIGIVGGIIVGQASVEAGLVSPIVVIVVAVTAIASFAIPHNSLSAAYRLVKFLVICLAASLGLFGFCLAIILVLVYQANLKTFGFPYLFPFCSGTVNGYSDLKDTFFRAPIHSMKKRPIFANRDNT